MRIDEPGNLDIHMYSTPSHDIDFDCWGPFDDMTDACDQLSCDNMVDCCYSTASTEHCHINNAQNGQYYILLITNYSNDTWVLGKQYRIFGDAYGLYNGSPWLSGRYTYTP